MYFNVLHFETNHELDNKRSYTASFHPVLSNSYMTESRDLNDWDSELGQKMQLNEISIFVHWDDTYHSISLGSNVISCEIEFQ